LRRCAARLALSLSFDQFRGIMTSKAHTEHERRPVQYILEEALEDADGDTIALGELRDIFGVRAFGPLFAVLGLLTVIPPLGAIPGLPAVVAIMLLLVCLQFAVTRGRIWLPERVARVSIKKEKVRSALERTRPILRRLDGLIGPRLDALMIRPVQYAAVGVVFLLAVAMIPLELVPFAVAVPGAAITVIGLAFLARDGVLLLMGFLATGLTVWMVWSVAPWAG
jgi:hypothetical protein